MERDRGADNPKRQIRRDTTQRPLASIFDPPLQDQVGEERRPRTRGTLRRPSRAGSSKEFGPSTHTSPLSKNLNRSESGARRELGLGGGVGEGGS